MMGIAQDTKLDPVEELKYTVYEELLSNCINHAMLHRLDLQQSRLQVKQAEAALNGAKAGWTPSVSGSVSNKWSNGHWPGDDNSNWGAGFNISMNIFDSGVTKSNVAAAKANLMTAKESYRQDTDNVELDVRNCYNTLRESEKRIATTQLSVAKAEEDYHIAQVRYEAGVGTNTDVLDAQVALHQARNNFNSALYDYNVAKVSLDTAMGIEARPGDYKYLTYGERYKATKAVYNEAVAATDSDKAIKDTVKGLEVARKERRKAAKADRNNNK
jgi:outer membrane protein TolC